MLSSTSFGQPVCDYYSLAEFITLYMSRAAEKLRKQRSYAGSVYVYIRTSPFKPDDPFYSNSLTIPLSSPTDDSRQLVQAALWCLKHIYKPNYNYAEAGYLLSELLSAEGAQTDMFSRVQTTFKSDALMATMDKINRKMGKESFKLASEGFKLPWKMKQGNKSSGYTTNWMDLTVVI